MTNFGYTINNILDQSLKSPGFAFMVGNPMITAIILSVLILIILVIIHPRMQRKIKTFLYIFVSGFVILCFHYYIQKRKFSSQLNDTRVNVLIDELGTMRKDSKFQDEYVPITTNQEVFEPETPIQRSESPPTPAPSIVPDVVLPSERPSVFVAN
uniref:Uncharacterized protein n=1 Tax=Abalone asfa-like virus TaxID=2839893 RepID=A0A5K7XYK6_9VIRU|nr:hypothetical protein [Abalone asfa-like virus]